MAGVGAWWGAESSLSVRTVAVGWVAAAGLVVSLAGPADSATPPPVAAPPAVVAPEAPLGRPDAVSARVTALATGQRVEVVSLRDEFSSTFVNPDGTWGTDLHGGQQRFRDEATGAWREVDLDLVAAADGSVAPKAHPLKLRLSGRKAAGEKDLVSVGAGKDPAKADRSVALGWAGKLPKPVLEGERATYAEVEPGVDLVVESRRSGFEQLFVVNDPAAVPASGDLSWSFTVKTKGLVVRPDADGGVSFLDQTGATVSSIPPATAWDAVVDERSGDPANVSPVDLEVVTKGNKTTVTVVPDAVWLADEARVFPVTVDPTYAAASVAPGFDTFVQSNISNTDQSAGTELKVGSYDGGTTSARSFLNFSTASIRGLQVQSASLSLHETWAYSCSVSRFYAYQGTGAAGTATRWSDQPGIDTATGSYAEAAKGYSAACPAGRVAIDVTKPVQSWAGGAGSTGTLRLSATEGSSVGWKKFASTETGQDPVLTFTYNRKPGAAITPYVSSPQMHVYDGYQFSGYARPVLRTRASDPDTNDVQHTFEVHWGTSGTASTRVASCVSGWMASGAEASCAPGVDLPDNTKLFVRVTVKDELGLWNGAWSPWLTFYTARTVPAAPVITCPQANGSWGATAPGGTGSCTVTATGSRYSEPGYVDVTVDGVKPASNYTGGPAGRIKITPSSDPAVARATVKVALSNGPHTVTAKAFTRTQIASATTSSYSFGFGTAAVSAPAGTDPVTTTSTVAVAAAGPPKGSGAAPTARLQWRLAGTSGGAGAGWADGPVLPVTSSEASSAVSTRWDAGTAILDTASGVTLDKRVPVLLEVQVCFTYPSDPDPQCTWSTSPRSVLRVPSAFGGAYPVAEAGPGQVALWTGEFATDATDVSVPGYNGGGLSVSRSHATYAGDPDPVTAVFGPGWTANLDGADVGGAGLQVVDSTAVDGTVALVDGDRSALVYRQPGGTKTLAKPGEYTPVGQDTEYSLTQLEVAGTGTAARLSLTEEDGTVTTWAPLAAPTAGQDTVWSPASVAEPSQPSATTFARDAAGRVTRILAPVPPGVTCPASGALVAGCRALHLTYGPAGGKTRLLRVEAEAYNPKKTGGAGMSRVTVADYGYDGAAEPRLTSVTDPRSGLTTGYGYDGTTARLSTVTPPGLAPVTLSYAPASGSTPVRLAKVTRPVPASAGGGTAILASVVYGIDPTTATAGLADLRADRTDLWGQGVAPTYGAAVFGPDHPVTSTDPAQITASDWKFADLSYTDPAGRTVNTATYGAGAWQVTSADYDPHDNVVRTMDPDAVAAAVDQATQSTPPAPVTGDALANVTVYTPDGALVTDEYGPTRTVALPDGTLTLGRPRTHTDYDQGAPGGGVNAGTGEPYNLPTTETTTTVSGDTATTLAHHSTVATGYTAQVPGTGDGWALGMPTTTTTQMGPGGAPSTDPDDNPDITRVTVYDTDGKVLQSRQPLSGGTDAGTTRTSYYTAAAQPTDAVRNPDPACANTPAWAGSVCRTYPAAAPSTGPAMPDARTTGYSMWLAPMTSTETSGTVTRTTTNEYLDDGRPDTTKTTLTGIPAATSAPVPDTKTLYDPDTGLPDTTEATYPGGAVKTIGTGYDTWGRAVTYTDEAGATTTTGYDAAGRMVSVSDPGGVTTYAYGTDSRGEPEYRPMPTTLTHTVAGSTVAEFTGAYDGTGQLVEQRLPGGLTQAWAYDIAGEPTGLTYTGPVTDPDTGTTGTRTWLSWAQDNDALGRVVTEYTPDGTAYDPDPANTSGAAPYHRAYTYDGAGRLTGVDDRTADPATGGLENADDAQASAGCTTRNYTFDPNGRRTTLTTRTAVAGDPCATTGGDTKTWAYDTADRPTTAPTLGTSPGGAYTYDPLGRTTTLPANDTLTPAAGDATLGYYTDDAPWTITQNGTTQTHDYDPTGRRGLAITRNAAGTQTRSLQRTYTDTSDNPTTTTETTPLDGTLTTRYLPGLTGDLTATRTSNTTGGTGRQLLLADPHGDITATLDPSTTSDGIDTWHDTDEYGNPRASVTEGSTPAGGTTSAAYGWLGTKERSADTPAGLTLMGARLYNSTSGAFTSTDHVTGGNDTTYAYPTDPINKEDVDGEWGKWKKWSKAAWKWTKRNKWNIALGAASFIPGVGAAAWAVRGGAFAVRALKASRLGNSAFKSKHFGSGSRWLGDKFSQGGRQGILNRGKSSRFSLGWSGRGFTVNGSKRARTVLRARIGGRKFNLLYGPWR